MRYARSFRRRGHERCRNFGHRPSPSWQTMSWPRPIPTIGDSTTAAERSADPSAWQFSDADREALYRIVAARRDVRRFRSDPIETDLVQRLLGAAHAAPSVGHSQPWRFVVVTDAARRER